MVDIIRAIDDILINTPEILDLLAENSPYFETDTTLPTFSKENSIIPATMANGVKNLPYITIRGGQTIQFDYHMVEDDIYIRVYNEREKSEYEINILAEKIRHLLHRNLLSLDDDQLIELLFESTLDIQLDEGINQNFKEIRFRALLL